MVEYQLRCLRDFFQRILVDCTCSDAIVKSIELAQKNKSTTELFIIGEVSKALVLLHDEPPKVVVNVALCHEIDNGRSTANDFKVNDPNYPIAVDNDVFIPQITMYQHRQ